MGCGQPAATPTTEAAPAGESAVVGYVNDGDTLRTTSGRRVRLVQIDSPELGTDCYGKAARAALQRLVPAGTTIRLVRDRALDQTDRYGRQLRYVWSAGRNVNLLLVAEGAASPYFFRNVHGRYAAALLAAAETARKARRGLWGACPGAKLSPGRGSITGPS